MIDEEATFQKFGYRSTDLKSNSSKTVVAPCDDCGKVRISIYNQYRKLCSSCAHRRRRGIPGPKNHGDKIRKFWREHPEEERQHAENTSKGNKGKPNSKEHNRHLSEARIASGVAKGENNPMFGNGYRVSGEKNGMFGVRRQGKACPAYIDGRSLLSDLIRNLQEIWLWKAACLKRDEYKCQECGVREKVMNVHHKRPFAVIMYEFLQEYSRFSPVEDKETLVKLAMDYEPFWDIDNGETLCEKHHNERRRETRRLISLARRTAITSAGTTITGPG